MLYTSVVEIVSHAGHCQRNLVNVETELYTKYMGEQDKSIENRSKCLAIGSLFPHSCYTHVNIA